MAATPDRTTIKAAFQRLVTLLRDNLTAEPPTATKPFRRVEEGPTGVIEYPRPFLTAWLTKAAPLGVADNDKLLRVQVALRAVTDITGDDPQAALLDPLGALEDYLDSIVDAGVLEGAEGFDDCIWTFEYPTSTSGARVGTARGALSFVVKIEREHNRLPAT